MHTKNFKNNFLLRMMIIRHTSAGTRSSLSYDMYPEYTGRLPGTLVLVPGAL